MQKKCIIDVAILRDQWAEEGTSITRAIQRNLAASMMSAFVRSRKASQTISSEIGFG